MLSLLIDSGPKYEKYDPISNHDPMFRSHGKGTYYDLLGTFLCPFYDLDRYLERLS